MSVNMNLHQHNWREIVQQSHSFACLVTPETMRLARFKMQLAYARQLGKPIYFAVLAGTRWRDTRDGETELLWEDLDDLCAVMQRLEAQVRAEVAAEERGHGG